MSGEDLSLLDQEGWMALLDFFGPYVSDVQAVAVVREPVAWARSKLQQSLKGGRPLVAGVVPTLFQDVEKRLGPGLASFGRDRLAVYDYDELVSAPGGLIPALAERCGVPPKVAHDLPAEDKNVRISAEASLLLGTLNKYVDYRKEAPKRIRRMPGDFRAFQRLPGSSFQLTRRQQGAVVERWALDAAYLKSNFGLEIEATLDPTLSEERISQIDDPKILSAIGEELVRGYSSAERCGFLEQRTTKLLATREQLRERVAQLTKFVIPAHIAVHVVLVIALIWALAT